MVALHRELFDRIVLIYNPANPRVPLTLAESVHADLRRRLPDVPVTVQPTRYAGHARELATAAAASGRPLIIAVSGDGVYNEVVNGIMDVDGSNAVSAVAAGGNANDHRRTTRRMPLLAAFMPSPRSDEPPHRATVTLGHVDQDFSDCAVLDGLVRVSCVCQREPVQRQAGVLVDGQCFVH
jgi:hypothetical protein